MRYDLQPEQRAYIEGLTLDTERNMLEELRQLLAKEIDLQNKIAFRRRSRLFPGLPRMRRIIFALQGCTCVLQAAPGGIPVHTPWEGVKKAVRADREG